VQLFGSMAPGLAFVQVFNLEEHYISYLVMTSASAVMLFLCGLMVVVVFGACLCAGHGVCKGACGCKVQMYFFGTKLTAFDCVDLPTDGDVEKLDGMSLEELRRLRPSALPSVWPVLRSTLCTSTLCALCVVIRVYRQKAFTQSVDGTIAHLYDNSRTVAAAAAIVSQTLNEVAQVVNDIQTKCWFTDPILTTATKDVAELLNQNSPKVEQIVQLLDSVPGMLKQVQSAALEFEPYEVWVPVLPQICIGLLGAALSVPALFVRFWPRARCLAHVFDIFLLWHSPFVALIILLTTAIATAELAFGIASSVICLDVDRYSMHYIKAYAPRTESVVHDLIVNAARHYLRGDVGNPIEALIDEAHMTLDQAVDLYKEDRFIVDLVGITCLPLYEIDVKQLADTATGLMSEARKLVAAANIWPTYQGVVQDEFCHQLLDGTAWMVVFQVAICLIWFPITVVHVHHFLLRKEEYLFECQAIRGAIRDARLEETREALEEVRPPRKGPRELPVAPNELNSPTSDTDTGDSSSDTDAADSPTWRWFWPPWRKK